TTRGRLCRSRRSRPSSFGPSRRTRRIPRRRRRRRAPRARAPSKKASDSSCPSERERARGPYTDASTLERQVRLVLQAALVVGEQAHALGRLHLVLLDRGVDLRLDLRDEIARLVLRHREDLADAVPLDRLFEVVAAVFVVIEEDVDLVHAAEE